MYACALTYVHLDKKPVSLKRHFMKFLSWVFLMLVIILPSTLAADSNPSYSAAYAQRLIHTVTHHKRIVQKVYIQEPVNHFHTVAYLHRVSAYNAVVNQTDSNPNESACGPTLPHNQIALSQNLFFTPNGGNRCGEHMNIRLANGQIVHGIVWDTMNARYYNAADILMNGHREAIDFGIQSGNLFTVTRTYKTVSLLHYLSA